MPDQAPKNAYELRNSGLVLVTSNFDRDDVHERCGHQSSGSAGEVNSVHVRPPVAATFPLGEIHATHGAFSRNQHVGAIVLMI